MFHLKTLHKMWYVSSALLWWSCQSPVAHSCGFFNHLNSFCGGMFKFNTKFDVNFSSTCSVILNATAAQYKCSLNGIYCPHWLAQWSHHCSHMCIPVHSPWLPGYIEVAQTVLIMLTMVGLFLDRPHKSESWGARWNFSSGVYVTDVLTEITINGDIL